MVSRTIDYYRQKKKFRAVSQNRAYHFEMNYLLLGPSVTTGTQNFPQGSKARTLIPFRNSKLGLILFCLFLKFNQFPLSIHVTLQLTSSPNNWIWQQFQFSDLNIALISKTQKSKKASSSTYILCIVVGIALFMF